MREIKFRVWNKTINEMTHDVESIDFGRNGKINQVNTQQDRILFPDKECVLMQYTGLKDKNGTEIYEGDIVQNGTEKMVVIWDESDAGYWLEFDNGNQSVGINQRVMQTCEVIGNIYENPDLLGNK